MAPTARAENTRQRVLDAALSVYRKHGHDGFNIHAIVAESGVSLGSIYHHFGSMDGLAAALYARSMGELLGRVAAALNSTRSVRRGVARIVDAYLQFARTQRTQMAFIHASAYASFLPAHATQIAQSKARIHEVRAFFAEHAAAGRIAPMPEWLLEIMVIGPAAELTRRWLSDSTINLDEARPILAERIFRAIHIPKHKRGSPAVKPSQT